MQEHHQGKGGKLYPNLYQEVFFYIIGLVHYVKCALYMDKAGAGGGEEGATAMSLSREHRRLFDRDVRKYGQLKNSKTGGFRSLVVPDLR